MTEFINCFLDFFWYNPPLGLRPFLQTLVGILALYITVKQLKTTLEHQSQNLKAHFDSDIVQTDMFLYDVADKLYHYYHEALKNEKSREGKENKSKMMQKMLKIKGNCLWRIEQFFLQKKKVEEL